MGAMEIWELLSYIVTVIGLPAAIAVFVYEQRRERENEEHAVYQLLSDNYQDFLRIALGHPDLKLFSPEETPDPTEEQSERMFIIFSMLVSLFERAYLLLHEDDMSAAQQRRWLSWEDYMREWCQRADFRRMLPTLLKGEDRDFASYIRALAAQERGSADRNSTYPIRDATNSSSPADLRACTSAQ